MLTYDLRPAGSENRYRRVVSCSAVQLDPSVLHWPAVRWPLSTVHFYTEQSAAVADYCSALFQDLV